MRHYLNTTATGALQLAAASDILSSGCMAQKHAHISNGVGSGAADGSPGGSCHPKGLPNQAMFFGDLPPWALRLMKLLPLGDLLPPDLAAREPSFDQAIVNLYRPGEGIASHVDLARFEDGIVSVSIGGPVVMHFTRCGQRVSIGGHISTGNDGLSASDEGCSTGGGATWISTCSGDGGARCWSAGDEGCNQRPGGMAPEQEALGGAQSPTGQAASHPPWKRQRCVLEAEGCLEGLPQLPASPFPSPQQRQQRQTHPEGPKEPPKPQQPDRCDAEIRGCDTACTIEGIQQQQQEQTDGGCATWNGGVRWCGTDHLCVLLQGGDLLGMSGEARYGWEHGIRMVASELWGERECDGCTRGTAAVVKATAVAATRCHDTDSPLSESDPGSGKDTETEIDPGKQQAREARLKSKGEPSAMSAVACNAEEGTGVEEGGPTAGLDTRFGGLVTEVVREQNAGKSEESGLIPIVRGVRLSITFRRLCPDIVLCEM
ncbi:hypothetical protein Vretifemale_4478 [Volvox reticuliferus]|uniref:Alpha-ketoglutarate-dependent dioxygenase AlkB-like domain-containing protein n=1 Tax=Volvox reticuliferus TaxID=1737510 RepID=A0A8J4C359_9CHLO|nr:hypothetical protein Vretifemale_4478 [Volvox reticuliferus]